ncbi:MAG: hypothetical protein MUE40_18565 [Anaerolineae bacterium]|jgi:hypothetical protein|nr:hypothetical protein [Anaerolineae bacterium]
MAVTVAWYSSDKRILHYRFCGEWTWDEYFEALARGRALQRRVPHMVCVINDLHETAFLPPDFIARAGSVSQTRPLNTGIAVYISTDYHFEQIYLILRRLYPGTPERYPLVATLAEALQLIDAWFAEHEP